MSDAPKVMIGSSRSQSWGTGHNGKMAFCPNLLNCETSLHTEPQSLSGKQFLGPLSLKYLSIGIPFLLLDPGLKCCILVSRAERMAACCFYLSCLSCCQAGVYGMGKPKVRKCIVFSCRAWRNVKGPLG